MENQSTNQDPTDDGFRWLELDEADVRYLLRKHFYLLILLPVVAFAASLIYCLVATPQFTTSALLYMRPNFDKGLQVEQVFSKLEDDDSLRSIEQAMVSDTVLLRMVATLGLRGEPDYLMTESKNKLPLTDSMLLKIIRRRYEAELMPTTRVMKLSVTDPSAERARLIADTLVDEFLSLLREELSKEEQLLREALVLQAGRALEEAMKSEAALEEFRMQNPEFLVEQDSSIFQERVLSYGRELNEAKAASSRLKGMVESLLAINPEQNPSLVFEIVGTRNNDYLSELLNSRTKAQADLAAAKQIYGTKNPNYRMAEERLLQAERSQRSYAAELKESAMSEYTASLYKSEELSGSLQQLQNQFVGFKSKSADFRGLKAEVDKNWNVHSELQTKILNLTLNPEVSPMVAIPLSGPVVPHKASHPSKRLIVGGSMVLSVILLLGYVLAANRHGLPFTDAGQVRSVLGLPVIGVLEIPYPMRRIGGTSGSPVTGGNLISLQAALGSKKLVHFSSLDRHEGLEGIPAELGEIFSRCGLRTLIITIRDDMALTDAFLRGWEADGVLLELPSPDRAKKGEARASLQRKFDLPVTALVHREEFRRFLKGLLADFDRVIVDTTGLAEPETILAVAKEIESNVMVVSEGGIFRREAAQFLARMKSESVEGITGVYVQGKREGIEGRTSQSGEKATQPGRYGNWAGFLNRVRPCQALKGGELGKAG